MTQPKNHVQSRFVMGCMGLGGGWNAQPITNADIHLAHRVIEKALSLGITTFDHADIYTFGKAETVFGRVLKENPTLKQHMRLQSKFGIRLADGNYTKRYDTSSKWVRESVNGILTRLSVERLDTLLIHRPDPLMALESLAEALQSLITQGKIGAIGVSNMNCHQMTYLQSALSMPIKTNQLEMSLAHRNWIEDTIMVNQNPFEGSTAGTIEYCMMNNVQLQAWGSLAQGRFSKSRDVDKRDTATHTLVNTIAMEYDVSPEAIVLAWLMRHPANIHPVLGTTNLQRLESCVQAQGISLSREHWYALLESARGDAIP